MTMTAVIKFNDIEGFRKELKSDWGNASDLPSHVLRIASVRRSKQFHMESLSVAATIRSRHDPDAIVRLDYRCGDVCGLEDTDEPVYKRAEKTVEQLEDMAGELGLEVRGGVLDPADAIVV